ncbi:beta-1,3-N-acetylglucosaminyltransferase manic fringe-like isoform X1 [Dysidea avara]|uniref:beta-1,3-N-acetylglucosaminyltransferase manic fringe-like isoform X1 n=1 Tax=Dysidea avara TaxID=196820 RepID=UPI003325CA1A
MTRGLDTGGQRCLRGILTLCVVVSITSVCFYLYTRQVNSLPTFYMINQESSGKETEQVEFISRNYSSTSNRTYVNKTKSDSSAGQQPAKSDKETNNSESPTNQVKLTKPQIKPSVLSSVIQINSTHVNGKLLENVDVRWDKNIYFSIKTTTKYFKDRLPALIPTWFQVVNKNMLTVVSEKSDVGTAMADVMKEAGLNLKLTDCDKGHTKMGLCCKTGAEFGAYYKTLEKYKSEMKSFQWYCHFDDDMYVNVPELSNLLQQYDPGKPYYIGSTDDLKYIHTVTSAAIKKLKEANIPLLNKNYQLCSGAAYCISHPLMMELKQFFNGPKAFTRMCTILETVDDFTVGQAIVSLLGHHRNLTTSIKTQQTLHLENKTAKEISKFVCVAPNCTKKQLESYAKSIHMSLSEDPTRFLAYHCLLYPTVSWCHK